MSNASVDAYRAKLRETAAAARASGRTEISRQSELLVVAIQERAPDHSGALKRSIRLKLSDDGMTATVTAGEGIAGMTVPVGHPRTVTLDAGGLSQREHTGVFARVVSTEYDYALAAEFGTRKEPAHPFFFPTYRARKRGIRSAIAGALTAPIRALWGG